jgi:uncharacterized protein (TIGR03089 family)
VQLGPPPGALDGAGDVPTALQRAVAALGNRPAVTVLSPRGREEQAVAALAQWAAKGAHLLEADLLLEPGDRLLVDAPWSWPTAAVCLAAWWAGVVVDLDGAAPVEVAVLDARASVPPGASGAEVLRVGDAITGAPLDDVPGEPWTTAVQAFPDQPPPPRADASSPALRHAGRTWSQAELLELARTLGDGTLGLDGDRPVGAAAGDGPAPAVVGLVALVLRPLLTGRPTVVLRGVGREAAAGERVGRWWPDG